MSDHKIFSYDEARALLPEVRRATAEAIARLEAAQTHADPEGRGRETRADAIATEWASAMLALGLEIKGLWLVDFDMGSGYYCWKHPEAGLDYFHTYEDGFQGRLRIQ